jgi:hypothetical protein
MNIRSNSSDPFIEGRATLDVLEKEMKQHEQQQPLQQQPSQQQPLQSNRQNFQAERKLLDQKPRGARLQSRKGSPLGLTLEVSP